MKKPRRTVEQVSLDIKEQMRTCTTCKRRQPFDCYSNDKSRLDGIRAICKECRNTYQRSRPPQDRDKVRGYTLKYKYNITVEQFDTMLKAQDGCCGICEVHTSELSMHLDKLCVDHDHTTGEIRGLLCHSCNRGIGYLQDNASNCKAAYEWLT